MNTELLSKPRRLAADRVAEQILDVMPLLKQLIAGEAMAAGALTTSQLRVISALAKGPCLPSALARQLRITPPTATEVVDLLVRRGLVERHDMPEDRRVTQLQLTPAGAETWHTVRGRTLDAVKGLLARMNRADVEALERGLAPLLESLQESRKPVDGGKDGV